MKKADITFPSLHPALQNDYLGYVDFLGRGGFCEVYLIKHKNGNFYAIKEISLHFLEPKEKAEILNEAVMLKKLKHPNIIGYYDAYLLPDKFCVIMEYAEGKIIIF